MTSQKPDTSYISHYIDFTDKTSIGNVTNPCGEVKIGESWEVPVVYSKPYTSNGPWIPHIRPMVPSIPTDDPYRLYEKIMQNIGGTITPDCRPGHLIARKNGNYFIKVELPGVDLSQIKVERQNSKITLFVSENSEIEFDKEEVEHDNTALGEYKGEYIWEIPSDVDHLPKSLFFKNGILTMVFSVSKDTESLKIEGESERDFLAEALDKINS